MNGSQKKVDVNVVEEKEEKAECKKEYAIWSKDTVHLIPDPSLNNFKPQHSYRTLVMLTSVAVCRMLPMCSIAW